MTTPRRPPRLERQEVQRRRERLIARALLRPDSILFARLQKLPFEQAVSRIVGQSITELGITDPARRARIFLWEQKRSFAGTQLMQATEEVIQRQFRQQAKLAAQELRKEFVNQQQYEDFLQRVGVLSSAYAKWLLRKE